MGFYYVTHTLLLHGLGLLPLLLTRSKTRELPLPMPHPCFEVEGVLVKWSHVFDRQAVERSEPLTWELLVHVANGASRIDLDAPVAVEWRAEHANDCIMCDTTELCSEVATTTGSSFARRQVRSSCHTACRRTAVACC